MPGQTPKEIFEQDIPAKLAAKPSLTEEVNASYEFNISGDQGGVWTVDLTKEGAGKITEGSSGKAGCVVTLADKLFVDIFNKKSNAQMAVMTGKLKLSNMGLALKLTKII